MEYIISIIFGIIEGITEWLPISSTGHMILLNELLPLNVGNNPEEFYSMFEVVIQLGAILAVVVLFFNKLWPFGKKKNDSPLNGSLVGKWIRKDIFAMWFHVLVSCVPAAIVGVLFDDVLEEYFYNYQTVAIALIAFGVLFIVIENKNSNRSPRVNSYQDISYKDALIIGAFQLLAAIFPGTSRSGATILGAILIGVARSAAAEYTFFLAVPVMAGASLLKILKFGLDFSTTELLVLLVGMVTAFVVSILVIRFFMGFIRKHDFKVFGWYRIVLGMVVIICGAMNII